MEFGRNENNELKIVAKNGRSIPCLDYYIGICPAPCVLKRENLDSHAQNVRDFRDFLKGKSAQVLLKLEEKMKAKAKKLEFEDAQKIKEQIASLKAL